MNAQAFTLITISISRTNLRTVVDHSPGNAGLVFTVRVFTVRHLGGDGGDLVERRTFRKVLTRTNGGDFEGKAPAPGALQKEARPRFNSICIWASEYGIRAIQTGPVQRF